MQFAQSVESQKTILFYIPDTNSFWVGILAGLSAYARTQPNWKTRTLLFARGAKANAQIATGMRAHGIIGDLQASELDWMRSLNIPLVGLGGTRAPDLVSVDVDNIRAGEMCARYYMARGLTHFAYLGNPAYAFSRDRGSGFSKTLLQHGHACHVLRHDIYNDRVLITADVLTLSTMTKPVGLFACNDDYALAFSQAAELAGMAIPDEVAVVGMDNRQVLCSLAPQPISSVVNPFEQQGFEAAKVMNQMLDGQRPPHSLIRVPPPEIITRRSSDILAVADAELAAALRFIRAQLCRRLSVDDIAAHVALSRRMLEIRFRRVLRRTPLEEIHRVRVERAMQLLTHSSAKMREVASQCGLDSAAELSRLFRRITGITPSSYRQQRIPKLPNRSPTESTENGTGKEWNGDCAKSC